MSEFFASGLVSSAGLVGGGVGQEGVSGGFPAGADVGQAGEDDRGLGVKVVLTFKPLVGVVRSLGLGAAIQDACGAQGAKVTE
ncbi:hypothetical protein [Spirillospora sp. NPDC048819]|uniref:hypothetical protein n=1 Tax=Spirillospora sp. NPDC048819 TaxID=3155268 RepID=UPI0033FF1D24